MLDFDIAIRDVFYLLFGIVSLMGIIYSMSVGRKRDNGDERERIVRIDENLKEMRNDVADIKAELRTTKNTMGDHERRIVKLEEQNKTLFTRVSELKH